MKQGNINKQQAQKQPYKSVWIIKYKLLNVQDTHVPLGTKGLRAYINGVFSSLSIWQCFHTFCVGLYFATKALKFPRILVAVLYFGIAIQETIFNSSMEIWNLNTNLKLWTAFQVKSIFGHAKIPRNVMP